VLTPFELGLVAHLLGDWLLQTEWMVRHKTSLAHPAAWVHGFVHAILLGVALGWLAGIVLGALHILLDSRTPLEWWQRTIKQTNTDDVQSRQIAVWLDQTAHILCIAIWIRLSASA
jgi:hypothetical protein